ncbi:MAG TPA: hypothetical protein PK767_06175 [Clostridiales bacterium]|nr:hypothetical protein [Clostridiales bacterium]HPP35814.1 hypothetical protein [Clostridiales bacterium]
MLTKFDVFWIRYAELESIDFIEKYGPRCRMIYLRDIKTPGERHSTEIGNSIIDMKKNHSKNLEIGTKYFIVEQENFDKPCIDAC